MSKSAPSGGMGFGSGLLLLFIGLKLTGFIDWSWFWVLSPAWIGLALVLVILFLIVGLKGALKK